MVSPIKSGLNLTFTLGQQILLLVFIFVPKFVNESIESPQMLRSNSSALIPNCSIICQSSENVVRIRPSLSPRFPDLVKNRLGRKLSVQCSEKQTQTLRTCKNCKTQFDPLLNHPRACCYHTAHFGGTVFSF